mmetsp:Transcript_9663/g.24249  ORF Transcript_9663/g.24249 Transcript_9663/m.24249 type:complete len:324 (-) Transcript_9663:151-1122(-)|eukprot:CAMPEP_0174885102 /NCGR_PEP_ID=MMETSP0167-20121228/480_1 /TAXON_ID=38298 /ORGANISM="Rhodella maculata, Strain CCMP736" /LENGTH=323 /DNA_ID=CAMNT_0016120609 /DNA_START=178 /DNA_END=1149 /DNA_ORIENTATION=+
MLVYILIRRPNRHLRDARLLADLLNRPLKLRPTQLAHQMNTRRGDRNRRPPMHALQLLRRLRHAHHRVRHLPRQLQKPAKPQHKPVRHRHRLPLLHLRVPLLNHPRLHADVVLGDVAQRGGLLEGARDACVAAGEEEGGGDAVGGVDVAEAASAGFDAVEADGLGELCGGEEEEHLEDFGRAVDDVGGEVPALGVGFDLGEALGEELVRHGDVALVSLRDLLPHARHIVGDRRHGGALQQRVRGPAGAVRVVAFVVVGEGAPLGAVVEETVLEDEAALAADHGALRPVFDDVVAVALAAAVGGAALEDGGDLEVGHGSGVGFE